MPAVDTYFITWKGRRDGPYSLEQLVDLLERGEIGLLHRVETAAGLVPLRDLLPATNPADFSPVKATSGLLGPLPAPTLTPAPELPPPTPPAPESLNPEQATRVYALCGLCFVFPPLAGWIWMMANRLAAQGQPHTAARLKRLSLGLAGGGILLWILFWRLW
jgi:hypothetical protein